MLIALVALGVVLVFALGVCVAGLTVLIRDVRRAEKEHR